MDVIDGISAALGRATSWAEGLGPQWRDVPTHVMFFGALFCAALVMWHVWGGLPWSKAALLGSCTMSSFHSLLCCIVGYKELAGAQGFSLDAMNTKDQISLTQFSLAYMISDCCFYVLPFTPKDVMFLVHHVISGLYVVGALACGAGAMSSVIMFFLGELTSPLLNAFTFADAFRHSSKGAFKVYQYLSASFSVAFVLVRTLVGVPVTVWFLYTLARRSPGIPLAWRAPMWSCVAIGVAGSQLFTAKLVGEHLAWFKSLRQTAIKRVPLALD